MSVIFTCALILLQCSASTANTDDNIILEPNYNILPIKPECGLFVAPSAVPGQGRVVIAGKFIKNGQIIDHAVTLALKHSDIEDTQLNNYVYGTNEDGFSMAEFGMAMLLNHHESPGVQHTWDTKNVAKASDQILAHTTFTTVSTTSLRSFEAGDEITCSYGGKKWFDDRNVEMYANNKQVPMRSITEVEKVGLCLTDVGVKSSKLPFAGKGLYARKDFQKGELITISPVLLIPKDVITVMSESGNSILQNYCMSSPYSNTVFLPIGWGALANHAAPHISNMNLDWYWWDEKTNLDKNTDFEGNTDLINSRDQITMNEKMKKMNSTLSELSKASHAQLDIKYTASKDIKTGDELTYSYGNDWAIEWMKYLAEVAEWNIQQTRLNEIKDIQNAIKELSVNACTDKRCNTPTPIPVPRSYGLQGGEIMIEIKEEKEETTIVPMPQFRFFIEAAPHLLLPKWRDSTVNIGDLEQSTKFKQEKNQLLESKVQDSFNDINEIIKVVNITSINKTEDLDKDIDLQYLKVDNMNNISPDNCDDYGFCQAVYPASAISEYL